MIVWNQKAVMRRLRAVARAIPGTNLGGSTRSVAITGLAAYAIDAGIGLKLTDTVLSALLCRAPHPEFDDGHREEMRERALEALDWAEKWQAWRNRNDWDSSARVMWLGELPEDAREVSS